ncbi:MAG: hypothetical protein QOD76_1177 [Solirubrobacteraceae bacterium]|jgi:hypothetical protein|nr:hypothetical protein [Solirubrobacteraceae bacterium]
MRPGEDANELLDWPPEDRRFSALAHPLLSAHYGGPLAYGHRVEYRGVKFRLWASDVGPRRA